MTSALIVGVSGPELTDNEAAFLAEVRPAGVILFARNCIAPDQIKRLVGAARTAIGDAETLVLIDQEGGRVQRLRPPHWRSLPPGAAYARLARRDPAAARAAAFAVARLLADELRSLGITMNCAPVLDVPVVGAHDIIGDRAFGRTAAGVAALAQAFAEGLMAGGVAPVVKHIPGHGRATADSHLALPRVDTDPDTLSWTDFAPFRALRHMPAAMTAHVVFPQIDPALPASISPKVTADIIRDEIGFDGLLMSDDIGMKALTGSFADRAAAVIAAGSDVVLHCSGDLTEMRAAASAVPVLAGHALRRYRHAIDVTRTAQSYDVASALAQLAMLAGESSDLALA